MSFLPKSRDVRDAAGWLTHEPASAETVALVLSLAGSKQKTTLNALIGAIEERTGRRLSRMTVSGILSRHGVARHKDEAMLQDLEQRLVAGEKLGPIQMAKAFSHNPALREMGGPGEGTMAGEMLTQAMFPLLSGMTGEHGCWQVHVVVDTWGVVAFADLCEDARMDAAVDLLHQWVLPWYEQHGVRVGMLETNRSRVYAGDATHVYGTYLRLHGIEHRVRGRGMETTNGYMARFKQALTSEFLLPLRNRVIDLPQNPAACFESIRTQLQRWVGEYNRTYPISGYRNNGQTPLDFWRNKSKCRVANRARRWKKEEY